MDEQQKYPAHNLKVAGSNPAPQPVCPRRFDRMAGIFFVQQRPHIQSATGQAPRGCRDARGHAQGYGRAAEAAVADRHRHRGGRHNLPLPGRSVARHFRRRLCRRPVSSPLPRPRGRLTGLRVRWVNPAQMGGLDWRAGAGLSEAPGRPQRRGGGELKARTLTNLYNARPQWLVDAPAALDAVIAAAYGWDAGAGWKRRYRR